MADQIEPDHEGFGRWLAQAREEAGLTQEQLAGAIGKGKSFISKLENATRHTRTGTPPLPALDTLAHLVAKLNVPITAPLKAYGFIKDAGTLLDERESKALRNLRQLPNAQRETMFEFLNFAATKQTRASGHRKTGTDN
jgi:transcriptional regulator with XRE-family HTH domain